MPGVMQDPGERPRHLRRPRLPDPGGMRRADRADRRRTRTLPSCCRSTADPEFRTSESCNLDPRTRSSARSRPSSTDLIGIEPEPWRDHPGPALRGRPAVQAAPRFLLRRASPIGRKCSDCGGQRTWTAMVFLNAPEGGGQTDFAEAGIKVTPRTGNLLTWNNLDAIGEPNPFSMHQGMPGHRRRQICHHQMVSRAALDLHRHADLLIRRRARRQARNSDRPSSALPSLSCRIIPALHHLEESCP